MHSKKALFFINLLERKMRRDPRWRVKFCVRNWHVSFIRAYFKPDDIWVDVSFNHGMAVQNTKIMTHLFDIQPEAAKFCLLIMRWLMEHDLEMKNYCLALLVIYFLQQKNLLPTIDVVQAGLKKIFINGKSFFDSSAQPKDFCFVRIRGSSQRNPNL
jgi:hypothetical protein